MEEVNSADCLVATENLKLWVEVKHPVQGRKMEPSTFKVGWLRSTCTRVRAMHGGQELSAFGSFVDAGSPLCSIEFGIQRARSVAEQFSVDEKSSMCIELEIKIQDTPVLFPKSPEQHRSHERYEAGKSRVRTWIAIPDFIRQRQPDAFIKGHTAWPHLAPRDIALVTIPALTPDGEIERLTSSLKSKFFGTNLKLSEIEVPA